MSRLDSTETEPSAERPLPLSQRLAQIIEEHDGERLTFSKLASELHARAWGGILIVAAMLAAAAWLAGPPA